MFKFYNILILKILNEIIPATKISISKGNKIFGAAILNKNDLSTVIVGTNNSTRQTDYIGRATENIITGEKEQRCCWYKSYYEAEGLYRTGNGEYYHRGEEGTALLLVQILL